MRYVDVKKTRNIYRKERDKLVYNIVIDHIQDAGYFVEFEILSQESREEHQIKIIFESFLGLFAEFKLQEEILPYRDIVKKLSS
jgi:adenylate cyclase class IV